VPLDRRHNSRGRIRVAPGDVNQQRSSAKPELLARVRGTLARGLELHQAGKLQEAERLYRKVLTLHPEHFDALHMLGVVALQGGRAGYAIDLIERALRQKPDLAAAHGNLAAALTKSGRLDEAIAAHQRHISLHPTQIDPHLKIASLLAHLGRTTEALASSERTIGLFPDAAVGHLAHAVALKDLQQYEAALLACERASELMPQYAEAWDKRGAALRELGRLDEALASHERAIALQSDLASAHMHAGIVRLQMGDLERGWVLYESRTQANGAPPAPTWRKPRWTGDRPLAGSTLMLHSEQGLGDTIQFCRYAKLAAAQGAKVVLSVQRSLRALIASIGPTISVMSETDTPPAFDWHCSLMSLPFAFKTTLATIPAGQYYLSAEPLRVARWREALGPAGFKIGISWQGSKLPIDVGRSFPVALFQALSGLPGIRLISLQKNVGEEQLDSLPGDLRIERLGGAGFDTGPNAFLDTAAIMESLDLVITSDTSIAHLAGALGRPTWVALKHIPDWRWLLGRSDSPWYPGHTLFRQERRGDWEDVFGRIRVALAARLAAG
jgi:Flp pilus assembly protein TadD